MRTELLPAPARALLHKRRSWRFDSMMSAVKTWPGMKILDVGCGINGRSFSDFADPSWKITGVDIEPATRVRHDHPNFTYRCIDGRLIAEIFGEKSFDLVVSVGMLEHITDQATYDAIRTGIQKVGKQYIVVVPWKWAWLEPHFGLPLFGAMPKWMQVPLVKITGRDVAYFHANFRWRTNAQYRRDFPGSRIKLLPTGDMIGVVLS